MLDMDSPAHSAVRWGELEKIKMLFETGQASPFDISDDGETLLGLALLSNQSNTAHFLIEQCPSLGHKIDLFLLQRLAYRWWKYLTFEFHLSVYFKEIPPMWDFLMRYVDIDEDTLHEIEQYFQAKGMPGKWAGWLPLLFNCSHMDVQALPRELRITLASHAAFLHLLKGPIGTDISTQEILTDLVVRDVHGYEVMLYYLLGLPFRNSMNELLEHAALLREVFEFDKLQGSDFSWSASTLEGFLRNATLHYFWCMNEPLGSSSFPDLWNRALQNRIQVLEDMGVDLVHYGQRETQAIIEEGREQYGYWKAFLCYGPKAVDWKFFFMPIDTEYEWAGDFWDWVENPELFFVPGAFPYSETDEKDSKDDDLLLPLDFDVFDRYKQHA